MNSKFFLGIAFFILAGLYASLVGAGIQSTSLGEHASSPSSITDYPDWEVELPKRFKSYFTQYRHALVIDNESYTSSFPF